jgi:hypothetical protein
VNPAVEEDSYFVPASINTPRVWKCPGEGIEATLMPLLNVVILVAEEEIFLENWSILMKKNTHFISHTLLTILNAKIYQRDPLIYRIITTM